MTYIQERGSTHVYHVNRMSKEEMDHMISSVFMNSRRTVLQPVLSKQIQKKCCFMLQKEILRKLWGSMRRSHHFP